MASNGIVVTEDAFKGVCGALFGLAVIAAIARTVIRLRTTPRYALDDALLMFACMCLTAATGLLYKLIPNAYLFEELDFKDRVSLPFPISDLAKETVLGFRILDVYYFTSWLVVFVVKFCFLSFFRVLIDRVQRMIVYWRVVVLITIIFGALSLCETFIACPHIDSSSLITIPISLLYNVRIKTRQKLGIGAFLCLSVVMIIVAIIKASGIRTSVDSINLVWLMFWQQVEACAAVLMVSITAFRSIFVSNKHKVDKNNVRPGIFQSFQTWLSSRKVSEGDARHPSPSTQVNQAPPRLTLGTSFRSVLREGLLGSHVQPVSQSALLSHSHNSEIGIQEEPKDPENLVTLDQGTDWSAETNFGSGEHQPGKEPSSFSSSQGTEPNERGHWWQIA